MSWIYANPNKDIIILTSLLIPLLPRNPIPITTTSIIIVITVISTSMSTSISHLTHPRILLLTHACLLAFKKGHILKLDKTRHNNRRPSRSISLSPNPSQYQVGMLNGKFGNIGREGTQTC